MLRRWTWPKLLSAGCRTWERAWPTRDALRIAGLYTPGVTYRSRPYRDPESGDYWVVSEGRRVPFARWVRSSRGAASVAARVRVPGAELERPISLHRAGHRVRRDDVAMSRADCSGGMDIR